MNPANTGSVETDPVKTDSVKTDPSETRPLRRPRSVARGGLLLLAVGLTGCSTLLGGGATSSEDRDLAEMKRRIVELQEQAAVAEVELDRLRREVAQLRPARGYAPTETDSIAEAPTEVAPTGGVWTRPEGSEPLPRPVPSGEIEVTDIGRTDAGGADIGAPRPVPASIGAASAENGLEPPLPVEVEVGTPPPPVAAGEPVGESVVAVSAEIPAAAQALYDEGYTLYHQGRYLDAEAVFQRFLSTYGALELTDNALYWIGECRYARGDFEGALASFQETASRFPEGNKVPAALLKSGRCLESLGDFASAKRAYDEVTSRFPDDPVAGVARQRVAQIR